MSVVLKARHGDDLGQVIATVAIGFTFVAGGLTTMNHTVARRTGLLMVWVGCAVFLEDLQLAQPSVLFVIGRMLGSISAPALVHVVLAYPEGRLGTRGARAVVAAGYATTMALPVVILTAAPTSRPGDNLLFVRLDQGLLTAANHAERLLPVILLMMAAGVLADRYWRASAPQRRVLRAAYGPATVCGALAMLERLELYAVTTDSVAYQVTVTAASVAYVLLPIGIMLGAMQRRMSGLVLPAVLEDLPEDYTHEDLAAVMRVALRDPSLRIVAQESSVPEQSHGMIATPVVVGAAPIATLWTDESLATEPQVLAGAVAIVGSALRSRALVEELALSRTRLVTAAIEARRAIERDLHDGAQQQLVTLLIRLRLLEHSVAEGSVPAADLARCVGELEQALADLRRLARGVHPMVSPALGLADLACRAHDRVELELDSVMIDRVDGAVALAAHLCVSECLTNVAKHAGASSTRVRAFDHDGGLVVEVRDDGVGGADAGAPGLRGIADRLEALGGRMEVHSPPGQGTLVTLRVPVLES